MSKRFQLSSKNAQFLIIDNKYGAYDKKTSKWDGIVGHIVDRVSFFTF